MTLKRMGEKWEGREKLSYWDEFVCLIYKFVINFKFSREFLVGKLPSFFPRLISYKVSNPNASSTFSKSLIQAKSIPCTQFGIHCIEVLHKIGFRNTIYQKITQTMLQCLYKTFFECWLSKLRECFSGEWFCLYNCFF